VGEREQVVVVGIARLLLAGGRVFALLCMLADRGDVILGALLRRVLGELLTEKDVCELGDQRRADKDVDAAIEDRFDDDGGGRLAGGEARRGAAWECGRREIRLSTLVG
jgi:hypothetical protein